MAEYKHHHIKFFVSFQIFYISVFKSLSLQTEWFFLSCGGIRQDWKNVIKYDEEKPLPKGQLEDRDSVYLKSISGTDYSKKLGRVVCGVFSPTRPTIYIYIYIDSKKNSLRRLRIRHTFLRWLPQKILLDSCSCMPMLVSDSWGTI